MATYAHETFRFRGFIRRTWYWPTSTLDTTDAPCPKTVVPDTPSTWPPIKLQRKDPNQKTGTATNDRFSGKNRRIVRPFLSINCAKAG